MLPAPSLLYFAPLHTLPFPGGICLPGRLRACTCFPLQASPSALRPRSSVLTEHRNFNLSSIAYASLPQLRSRLTQGRSALPWKPWISGLDDSHIHLATHSGILSSWISTAPYRYGFCVPSMLPYQSCMPLGIHYSMASVTRLSTVYFRRRTSRLVSYYALFECVAASEPTS